MASRTRAFGLVLLLLGALGTPLTPTIAALIDDGAVWPTETSAMPAQATTTPKRSASGWYPAPDVEDFGVGSIVTHGTEVLAWLDMGRSPPRTFNITYRYLAPATSLTGLGRIEIGLTPHGSDESEAWVQFDGATVRSLLGLGPTASPRFAIDKPHQEGFLSQTIRDITGDALEDFLVRIPHFSTPWITVVPADPMTNNLLDIWGSAPGDLWVSGTQILRHTTNGGATWTDGVPGVNPGVLHAIEGSSASLIFASGFNGKIWKFNGATWTDVSATAAAGWQRVQNNLFINDIALIGGKFYFVGTDVTNGFCFVGCQAFIGTYSPSTNVYSRVGLNGLQGDLRGVWGSSGTNVWAVGESATPAYQQEGLTLRFDGSTWMQQANPWDKMRIRVHGTSDTNVYAGGIGGDVWKRQGAGWALATDSTDDVLYTIRSTSSSIVWAGGCENACQVLHQGVQDVWADVPIPTSQFINGLWSSGVKDVWAVGSNGLVLKYAGAPPRAPILSVPAQNAMNQNPSIITLTTNAAVDPDLDPITSYKFYVTTNFASLQPGNAAPAPVCTTVTQLSCSTGGLIGNTYHYWRVDACDTNGCTPSEVRTFKTAPAATACIRPFTPNNLQVTVDGGCSSDGGGGGLTYDWDWGDGTNHGSGVTSSHTYNVCPGQTFTLRLTVTSGVGATATTSQLVNVRDRRDAEPPLRPGNPTGDGLVRCREDAQGTSDNDWDSDDDGLVDGLESQWLDELAQFPGLRNRLFCNNNQACPDAPNPMRRDLYVEIDWLNGLPMSAASRTIVVNNFANAPINTDPDTANDVILHLDTGTIGGGGTPIPFEATTSQQDVYNYKADEDNFALERRGIYRYGVIACRMEEEPSAGGWGVSPGSTFANFYCPADYGTTDDRARIAMHEMGHNILGWQVNEAACANRPDIVVKDNPTLGHFGNSPLLDNDCNGDGTVDVFNHASDPTDVMLPDALEATTNTYEARTWADLKLDFGIDGTVVGTCPDTLQGGPCTPEVAAPVPCDPPAVGFEPACTFVPEPCPAPLVGVEPDCTDPGLQTCQPPQVGFSPDCVDAAPPCAANQVGVEPVCASQPTTCDPGLEAEQPCVSVCPLPAIGVVVGGVPLCMVPPQPCPSPNVGVGSACTPAPAACQAPSVGIEPDCVPPPTACPLPSVGVQPNCFAACPPGSVGVTWNQGPDVCVPQPQPCTLPSLGVQPVCVQTCPPGEVGLVVGSDVICVPPPTQCPPGTVGIQWSILTDDICFPIPTPCPVGQVGLQPNCVDPEDVCTIFPGDQLQAGGIPSCVQPSLCSAPQVGIIVGSIALCLTPPQPCPLPQIGVGGTCIDPQDLCINTFILPDEVCVDLS